MAPTSRSRCTSATRLLVAAWLLGGCGREAEPALAVGALGFTAEQVSGLDAEQRALLADLAALGLAVAEGRGDSLVAPLARREAHRSRLIALPYVLGAAEMGITEDRMREAYARAPERELRVRHVVRLVPEWAGADARADAARVAAEVERRARAGEDFSRLAAELSEEPGAAERGGLLEWGREGSWVEPFWRAALALEPGEVSPVVETEYGYHVLKLEDRRVVPFEEAARLPVLRRVVPGARARSAMEAWVADRPPVVLDPPAVLAARRALEAGEMPDTVVLARSPAGSRYTGRDLALAWAAADADRRQGLEAADDASFAAWAADDVREAFWADEAARLGAEPVPGAEAEARLRWGGRVAGWAEAAGFEPGLDPAAIAAAALRALAAGGQEARIVRAELPGLRPLLRDLYPVSPGTSSEMR